MTNEQWLIYLYGIYPEGGISVIAFCILVLAWAKTLLYDETLIKRQLKINKFITVIAMIIFITGYFIPPNVKESLIDKDGKLHKIDSIIDKALNKADNYLSDKKDK